MSFFFIDDAGGMSLSYIASAESTAASVTIPASAQTGDIAVLYDVGSGGAGSLPSLVTPSGWDNRVNSTSGTMRAAVHTKVLTGGDPSLSITGINGSFSNQKLMLVFRPTQAIQSVTASSFTSELTSGNPSSQVAAAGGQVAPVIVLAGCRSYSPLTFSTATPAFDGDISASSNEQRVGYKLYSSGSTPTSHTIDIDDAGSQNHLWAGFLTLS